MEVKHGIYFCRWQDRGEVCGWGWAMTPERPESPRNISCWTSGSAAAPSTVRTRHSTGQQSLYISQEVSFKFIFLLSTLNMSIFLQNCLQHQWFICFIVFSLHGKLRPVCLSLTVGSSLFPLLGYSLSDMPVKPKRSSLNYSLPITFNKTGELVNLVGYMYLVDIEESATKAARWNTATIHFMCFFSCDMSGCFLVWGLKYFHLANRAASR